MLELFVCLLFIYDNLDHWLKVCGIKKAIFEMTIDNIDVKSTSFHNWNLINEKTWFSFFKLAQLKIDFCYFLIHSFNIFGQKFDVVFTIFKSFELLINKFIFLDLFIAIFIHVMVNFFKQFGRSFWICYKHKIFEFFLVKVIVSIFVIFFKGFFDVLSE